MAREDSPLWRRAFDGVERRVSPRIAAATSSPDFQVATQLLRRATRVVTAPVGGLTAKALHVVGLPTHGDVRLLTRSWVRFSGRCWRSVDPSSLVSARGQTRHEAPVACDRRRARSQA